MEIWENSGFYLSLLQDYLEGRDLQYLVKRLADNISRPVIITDQLHRVLVSHHPDGGGWEGVEYLPAAPRPEALTPQDLIHTDRLILTKAAVTTPSGTPASYYYTALSSSGHTWGHAIFPGEEEPPQPDLQHIWEAALIFLQALKAATRWQQEQEQYQDEFVRDILYNVYDAKAVILEKARLWNWDLNRRLAVAVLEMDKAGLQKARETLAGLGQLGRIRPICVLVNDQVIIIIPLPGKDKKKSRQILGGIWDRCRSLLAQSGDSSEVRTGIGSPVEAVTNLYKSYQEAKVALELGKLFSLEQPCYFEEMGFLKFIFTQPAQELQEFSQRILSVLFMYDQEKETELVNTLKAYIAARCQIADCAGAMFVHENTLRNRLKKIEELTGYDLRRVDHLLNIYVALQIVNLG
jgi:sugar diacid utilization regulator